MIDLYTFELQIFVSSLSTGHTRTEQTARPTSNASALRQDILFLTSIFQHMEIKKSSCLERSNGTTTAGDKFSLCVSRCGVVAQPASVWLVSLGGCGLAKAQSAMMFTSSKEL